MSEALRPRFMPIRQNADAGALAERARYDFDVLSDSLETGPASSDAALFFVPNSKRPPGGGPCSVNEVEYARLLKDTVSAAPIYTGLDGGMNKVFLAQFPGRVIPLA